MDLGLSTDPVGPSGWTARQWLGLAVQLALFAGAVAGLYWLGRSPPGERGPET